MKKQKITRRAGTRQLIRKIAGAGTLAIALASSVVHAALHDRGGGLVYDDVLDVTWLADANYSRTSGYDDDGLMNWFEAMAWAEQLSYDHVVGGITIAHYGDWRLPMVRDGGIANYVNAFVGTDYGYNVRTVGGDGTVYSELAYMYYVNLGFKAYYSTTGTVQDDHGIFENGISGDERDGIGPNGVVENLQSDGYWSGTPYAPYSDTGAWGFYTGNGYNFSGYQYGKIQLNQFYAWAVRPGDVAAIPEPKSAVLFGLGLVALTAIRQIKFGNRGAQGWSGG